jgi:hypothetical protein
VSGWDIGSLNGFGGFTNPEPFLERIPARHREDDYVYCERHLRMVRKSEGCPKCGAEKEHSK